MLAKLCKIVFASILVLSAISVSGQVATGNYTYGTFDNHGFDSINVGNLNVHFSMPVLNKPGRGMSFYYNLVFDSSVWYPSSVSGSKVWTPTQGFGWHGDTEVATGYVSYEKELYSYSNSEGEGFTETIYHYFTYHDPFGNQHPFTTNAVNMYCWGKLKPSYCSRQYPSFTEVASDGSGYTLAVSNYTTTVLTGPTGKTFAVASSPNGAGTVTDLNGNEISADGAGNFTDTTGNVALTVAGAGTAESAKTFTYKDTSGNSQSVTMTYANYTVQTNFGCSGIGEYGPTVTPLVHTITYADGSTYTLSYEATPGVSEAVTGRISSVELPQGNSIAYTYSNGIECSDGSTAGLTRTLNSDSGSAASSWAYSRTITGTSTSTTAVTDGLGNNKTYTFVTASNQPVETTAAYYETSRNVYQGTASGTPVLAQNTCYNGASSPCSTDIFTLPVTHIDTYEVLDGTAMHGHSASYNANGAQTDAATYDFGTASSRGSRLRWDIWVYGGQIPTLPTLHHIADSNGNDVGKTEYGYDGTTTTASSGIPQHVAASGARGNLTSVKQYASDGTYYTSSASYEDTGSILSTTTPNGTTTFGYDSSFVYNTSSSSPTPSSGISLSTSEAFDTASTGLPLSSTDQNSEVTKVQSYDSMLRLTEIDYPDGGVTKFFYSPTMVDKKIYQSSSSYTETIAESDGYGRSSSVYATSGLSGTPYYQQDACYDANGNTSFISYVHLAASTDGEKVCSGAGDTSSYDVLGRVTRIVKQNGETTSYTYKGRAVQTVDPNGITKIVQSDGLGRKTTVCEVSSKSLVDGSGSPSNCGTDISGTGYVTTYSYNLSAGTTTITQGAQTRIFSEDWLGRPVSITEPESGTTTYSYSYNSTGLQVVRTKPQANQTSSATTTTTTQFDSLNRPVSITYSDGTPAKTFAYDAAAGANFNGFTQSDLKGRLSIASTANTGTAFSYDQMGRTVAMSECLPSGCGTVSQNKLLQYTYDTAGNMLTSTDGNGTQSTYTVDTAGQVTAITSSLNDSSNPENLLSSVQYGAFGPASYNLGNNLAGVFEYDSLGRLSSGGIKRSGTPNKCYVSGSGYRFSLQWKGDQLVNSADSVLGQSSNYVYDDFNRLTARTVTAATSGPVQNLQWDYDRYGNRWHQTLVAGTGSAPQPSLSFSQTNNQIAGIVYDAAGEVINDGSHAYSYDADGNLVSVDNGATANYVYNALNQRVRTTSDGTIREFVFNSDGQRVSEWSGTSPYGVIKGHYYWGSRSLAYYYGGATHFEHQDWIGTERMRTSYNGSVEAKFTSLPWGDSLQQIKTGGSDTDSNHYAMLDHDAETYTEHAQFRQYNSTQSQWMSPDPYTGSYDFGSPQSLNRYAYVINNPINALDPNGAESVIVDGCNDGTGYVCFRVIDGSRWDWNIRSAPSHGGGDGGRASGGSGGSGGGGGSNHSAANNDTSKQIRCARKAAANNGVAAVTDGLGAIPGGGQGLALTQLIAGGVSYVNSVATMNSGNSGWNSAGAVGSVVSNQVTMTNAALKSVGMTMPKLIPFAGNLFSLGMFVHDVRQSITDYNTCMAGN